MDSRAPIKLLVSTSCKIFGYRIMNLGGNRSKLQKAPFQLFVQALLCLIIVLASYMSSNDNTTEARSNASRNPMQSTPSRGKFVGNSFNAKDLFLAYKEIESTYHQVAFAETSQHLWRTLVDKNDVEVALMEHQSDPRCPYVRMAVEIDVPVEDCWEFLSLHNWDKTMPKMDPFYEGVELHGGTCIRSKLPFPYLERQFLHYHRIFT